MPTFSEIEEVFHDVRLYYKKQTKSDNKEYTIPDDLVMTPKELRRNLNTMSDVHATVGLRPPHSSYEDWGFNAMNVNARHGNCVEMACVAAALIRERFSDSKMFGCTVHPPGDHFFVAVGDILMAGRVCELLFESCVIVDPWMNICCQADDYADLAIKKLNKWSEDGKLITSWVGAVSNRKVYWNPRDLAYQNGLLGSRLTYQDTKEIL